MLYRCLSLRSVEYCTGLFVWGLEVCVHLVVGGVCVAQVHGGGLRCWGLCAFVIKSVRRLWVFSVVVVLDSGNGRVVLLQYFSLLFIYKFLHTRVYEWVVVWRAVAWVPCTVRMVPCDWF